VPVFYAPPEPSRPQPAPAHHLPPLDENHWAPAAVDPANVAPSPVYTFPYHAGALGAGPPGEADAYGHQLLSPRADASGGGGWAGGGGGVWAGGGGVWASPVGGPRRSSLLQRRSGARAWLLACSDRPTARVWA
jgi:hypothetical protein